MTKLHMHALILLSALCTVGHVQGQDKKAVQKQTPAQAAKKGQPAAAQKAANKDAAKKTAGKKAAQKKQELTKQAKKQAEKQEAKKQEAKKAQEKKEQAQPADTKKKGPAALVLPEATLKSMRWRSIGPSSMGGRIIDLEVVHSKPSTFYVGTASGGLFKTTNNGVTFTPLFQHESTISIGDVCVAPSDPNIVWIGTGENNARNSVSWGDGVYKSVDGGKTWTNMGLKETFQIGGVVIHPKDPNIVLVGALGRLWGKNEQRGIFKTVDGGKTWKKVLYVNDMTGCIDIKVNPGNPNHLLAAMYERQRDPFDGGDPVKRFGWGSGMFQSKDGGDTWERVTKGLPTVKLGRIGIDFMKSKPNIVYAVIESERIGQGPSNGVVIDRVTRGSAAAKAGLKAGDIILRIGKFEVKSYAQFTSALSEHHAGDKVKVALKRAGKAMEVDLTFGARRGAPVVKGKQQAFMGVTAKRFGVRLGGQVENRQKEQGEDGFQTGGIFKSTDSGASWKRVNSLNPRPFYFSQIRVDPNNENNLYVMGIRLHRSTDGGKTFRPNAGSNTHPDHHSMWIDPRDSDHVILGCDGGLNISFDGAKTWDFVDNMAIGQFYHVGVDTRAPYFVYGGLQDNGSWGGPSAKRESRGPQTSDWFAIGGGDGFICLVDPEDPNVVYYESQYGGMGRLNLKTGGRYRIRQADQSIRWNWKTPFLLSHHNSKIFYCAGNKVFKSLNQGNNLRAISPDLTSTKQGTATALAESPLNPLALYVGTDDGNLWATTDGGTTWNKLKVPGLPGRARVQSLETSRFAAGRAYVAFDGHYYNDDKPHVYVTEDYGKTWTSIRANLPVGSSRVLREDVRNQNLLYLGTEFGVWCSLDRGQNWMRLNNNLPHVAVHEIAVHPTAGEIVAGTHGRSLWILDVNELRQMSGEVLAKDHHLFRPKKATIWQSAVGKRYYGFRHFIGSNPARGATISYCLKKEAKRVTIKVTNTASQTVTQMAGGRKAGMNRVPWNLASRASRTRRATPGDYLVTIDVDGTELKTVIQVQQDPEFSASTLTFEQEQALDSEEGDGDNDEQD